MSLPTQGAWIEITLAWNYYYHVWQSLPTQGAWIEMGSQYAPNVSSLSLPTQGAWIEIIYQPTA